MILRVNTQTRQYEHQQMFMCTREQILEADPHGELLTKNVDKDFVQVESQQRFFEPVEIIGYCSQNISLEPRVHRLFGFIAIWPCGKRQIQFFFVLLTGNEQL